MTDSTTEPETNPFQQARLLNADRLQLLNRSLETLATAAEEELSRWLSDVTVSPGEIRQTQMSELADGQTDLAIIKARWAMTHGVITTDLVLALSMIAMLCGGIPNPPPEPRPLSRLEMGVYDLIAEPLMNKLVEILDIGESELGTHTSSLSALPDSQKEPAVYLTLAVKVGSLEGWMGFCLSGTQMQSYLEEIDRRVAGRMAGSGRPNQQIVRAVQPVVVDLIAGFEPLQVPAKQLVGLQVGDVLRTRQSITRPLVARVGDERLFQIKAGQQGQRLVAHVTGHADHGHGPETARADQTSTRGPSGGARR